MTALELLRKYHDLEHEEAETCAVAKDLIGLALHSYGEKIVGMIIKELEKEERDAHV